MRKHAIAATCLALFAMAAQAQPVQTWSRYLDLTVNTASTSGGAGVTGAVTNFPLLVRLDSANASAVLSQALANGADIRFASETGAELPHYIESWSATRANIWVRVPSIAGNGNTKVRLFWGKPGVTTTSSASAVFDTTAGFTGVWKMNEGTGDSTVAVGAGNTNDATANALHFTRHSDTRSAPGVIGFSRYYNPGQASAGNTAGSLTTYIVDSIANGPQFQAKPNAAITISAWVNRQAGTNAVSSIFGQFRYSAGANRSYNLMRNAGGYRVMVSTGGTGDDIVVATGNNWGAETNGTWQHVTATISATNGVRIYVNGVQEASDVNAAQPFTPTAEAARPLIGAMERNFSQRFIGLVDELRFSNGTVRNADWVKLDYETQKPGATAVAVGAATDNDTTRVFFYPLKNATYTQSTPISNNTPYIKAGNTATAFAIAPTTMPAGLAFSTSTGVISGTPTAVTAQTQFIVTATIGGNPHRDTITIAVVGGNPPGAPGNVTAVRGNAQATVSWVAPGSSGTSAITGYRVRAVEDTTKTCLWTTGALTCTVTGLTNGTAYTFTVQAANSFGYGAASTPSSAVTPAGTPGAPTNVVASQGTPATTVTVTWTAPASNGGLAIADYYATATPGGQICYAPAPVVTCNITGLTVGTSYTMTVVAANAVGSGPASAPSNAIIPGGTSILPGSFTIQVTGSSKPFSFALTPEAIASTDALTMSIMDMQGRTVWTRTVNPAKDGTRELIWNGVSSTGRAVSAGVYMVRVATVNGGNTADFIRPAVSVK